MEQNQCTSFDRESQQTEIKDFFPKKLVNDPKLKPTAAPCACGALTLSTSLEKPVHNVLNYDRKCTV